jgi:hypothetical protein
VTDSDKLIYSRDIGVTCIAWINDMIMTWQSEAWMQSRILFGVTLERAILFSPTSIIADRSRDLTNWPLGARHASPDAGSIFVVKRVSSIVRQQSQERALQYRCNRR